VSIEAGTLLFGAGARDVAGADTRGAPSPSDGNGVRPVSIGALAAGLGASAAGAAAPPAGADGGAGARASEGALRLPNKTTHSQRFPAFWFLKRGEGGRQQPAAKLLGFHTACKRLRHLAEHCRRLMTGRHFSDHLTVVRGGAEKLRFKRDHRDRLAIQC